MTLGVDLEDFVQKPHPRTLWKAFRHEFHWKCLLTTLLVHLCISYAVWCHLNHYAYSAQIILGYSHGPCSQGYNFIPIAFGIMLYIVYIMECWHNRAKISKIKKVNYVEALEYIEKMRNATPIVWWKSVCYHYIRRTRQLTRYRNGDAITATQVFYERINSHTAGSVFIYDACGVKDISKSLIDLERYPITKIMITKGFVFACMQAANEFEEQRARFFTENEIRDDYMEIREGLDFAGLQFIETLLVYSSPSNKCPWYLSPITFWLFSIVLLSWPLRLICDLRTAHVNYQISKLFGTNYLSPSSINYTGPVTRTSTIDSRELDLMVQRDGYLIVPSYSEAMLMEPNNTHSQWIPSNGHFWNRNRTLTPCNENTVIKNYGAVRNLPRYYQQRELRQPSTRRNVVDSIPLRSCSMNLMLNKLTGRSDPLTVVTSSSALPRTVNGPPRSVSVGGISAMWRSSGYNSISEEPMDDRHPLIEPIEPNDEPPPSYEVALKMCAPLCERLRRSANSLTSRLNPLSHSYSKEFSYKRQFAVQGQGSSRGGNY